MKRISYILSIFISVLFYTSCDSLDLSPEDYYGSSNFWNNEAQVKGFMTGLHTDLRGDYTLFYLLGEARGGTSRTGTSSLNTSLNYSSPIKDNQFTKDNVGISSWGGIYSNIMQMNHFIQKVENECAFLSTESRNTYLGQAYGLRALYYFMLYRTWGGVPKITDVKVLDGKVSADKLYTARSTAEETLAFIKEDIVKSETFFTNTTAASASIWSKNATLMLKADIYLWSAKVTTGNHTAAGRADLEVAKTALQGISGYSLMNDFSSVFSSKGNNEIIFAIRFMDTEATNWGSEFLYAQAGFVDAVYGRDGKLLGDVLNLRGNGLLRNEYKESLWRSYDATDSRRDKTFFDFYSKPVNGDFGIVLKKCIGIINSTNDRVYETDVVLYRYADWLLMMAEIENGLGNSCQAYINQVRQRAYGDNYNDQVAYKDGSYAENEMAILHERDKEFVWEGKRWFDVVRMHDANGKSLVFSASANYPAVYGQSPEALIPESQSHKLLWPVDVNTLNNDPLLEQTPGY